MKIRCNKCWKWMANKGGIVLTMCPPLYQKARLDKVVGYKIHLCKKCFYPAEQCIINMVTSWRKPR